MMVAWIRVEATEIALSGWILDIFWTERFADELDIEWGGNSEAKDDSKIFDQQEG